MAQRLMIAVPARASVRAPAFAAQAWCAVESTLWWRETYGPDSHVMLHIVYGPAVAVMRTQTCEEALRLGIDWILWMDDDCVPNPGLLARLMSHGKKWIAPSYFDRKPPHRPHCYEFRENRFRPVSPWPPRLFRVDGIGFHCNLMHTDVVRRVRALLGPGVDLFRDSTEYTEDLYFCLMALKAGCELWVDSSVEVGHVSEFTVTSSHWEAHGRKLTDPSRAAATE
ncbi:MAG: hypothetical protein HYY13_03560 [Nitrospirae bacterium]|nr:hypothetical protein [Nitrospirota bacterium]